MSYTLHEYQIQNYHGSDHGDQQKLALEAGKKQSELSDILPEQQEFIKAFFEGK